jgi:hypothetical protein
MHQNMSILKKLKVNLLTVTILSFFFFFSSFNALTTNTKTLEGMSTNFLQQLSNFKGAKMVEIQSVISQLIELSKYDQFETYQRNSFDELIQRVRDLVDEMLGEQRREDVQFKNVTNLLMRYHLRQTNALEMVKDKHQLSLYFIEFINSLNLTPGVIDIKTDYKKLISILILLQKKLDEYQIMKKAFTNEFSSVYENLRNSTYEFQLNLKKNENNPYLQTEMKRLNSKLNEILVTRQAVIKDQYLYNIDASLEYDVLTDYISYFQSKTNNETTSITPMLLASFEKQTKEAREELSTLSSVLRRAEEAIKITDDSIRSNVNEYEANVKSRAQVVEVIYQILELINKRSKKIKGFQLKYVDSARTKFFEYENSFEFVAYKKYIFKEPPAAEILARVLPKLPDDLSGIEDKNAQAPKLENHVPFNPAKKV